MNVAILAPIAWKTPPDHYGPWELIASLICEGLVKRGINVTLFATTNSKTNAKLESVCPQGYEENENIREQAETWQSSHISNCMAHADEFDIIHNHANFSPLLQSDSISSPVVTTMHSGTIEFRSADVLNVFKKYNPTTYYVALSRAAQHEELEYTTTIPHGIDLSTFTPGKGAGNYLLSMGRIHPDKGVADAITIARRTNQKLIIAGIIHDEEYFATQVKPYVDGGQIQFIGSVGGKQKTELLGNAAALLSPIHFDEPFGLSVIEAMACGTPVIAFSRGAMPEVIAHKKTGFVVSTIDEAVEAVSLLPTISRGNCRQHVEDHFSVDRMVDEYVRLYEFVINDHAQKKSL